MVIRRISLQTCMILMWLLSPLLTLNLFAYGEGATDRGSLHNEKLSVRFAELLKVNSADSANKIVKEIWNIWINDSPVLEHRQMLKDGIRLMSKQDYMAAEKIFSEIIEVEPEYIEAWNKRATVRYIRREFDKSLSDIYEVLSQEPNHFGALAGLGLIMLTQQDFEGALLAYKQVLLINPFSPDALILVPELIQKVLGLNI